MSSKVESAEVSVRNAVDAPRSGELADPVGVGVPSLLRVALTKKTPGEPMGCSGGESPNAVGFVCQVGVGESRKTAVLTISVVLSEAV